MAERNMRVRLGAFVAVTLAALTGLVVVFGGTPTLFTNRVKYAVTFPEAPGLAPGTPVRKSGVRIGQVTGLDIDEDTGRVRVNVEIEGKHLPRQNEEPVISRGLLSGDTSLDFIPRVDEKNVPVSRGDPYPSGTEIVGVAPLNTQRLISQAQGTIPDAQAALAQFSRTIGKFEQVGPKTEKALDEIAAFVRSGREVMPELRQTNLKVQEFIGQADDQPGNLKAVAKELQEFLKILGPFVADLRAVLGDNREDLNRAIKGIALLTDRANDALNADNRKALADSLKNFQTGSKGFNDVFGPENRKNLADTLKNLNTASDDLTKAIRLAAILVDRADTTVKELNKAIAAGGETIQKAGKTVDEATARVAQTKGVIDNIEKATKPLADNAEPTIKNIARAADELAKTVADARQVIALLTKPEGTLGKVVSDPQLYNQLVDAAANLNRTLIRAEKIAKDLEVFADKVARKPETVGVGGALRPSTGLKESPYAPLPGSTPYPGPAGGGGSGGGMKPIAPVPGGADEPIPPVSSFKIDQHTQPGPRVAPLPPVRPQILGEPK